MPRSGAKHTDLHIFDGIVKSKVAGNSLAPE